MSKELELHEKKIIVVANGAGYIKCSCGWRSEVEQDADMYIDGHYNKDAEYKKHLKDMQEKASHF